MFDERDDVGVLTLNGEEEEIIDELHFVGCLMVKAVADMLLTIVSLLYALGAVVHDLVLRCQGGSFSTHR